MKPISERQKEIIQAALGLIAEQGIQSLTIKNIAARVGFAESAVYRHFENKTQILVTILDMFASNSKQLFNQIRESETDSLKIVTSVFKHHFKIFKENPSMVSVIFSEEIFRNEAILSIKVTEIINQNMDDVAQVVKAGQQQGSIRDDIDHEHMATMIMGTLRMFIKQWHMGNYNFDLNVKGQRLIESVIQSIKK